MHSPGSGSCCGGHAARRDWLFIAVSAIVLGAFVLHFSAGVASTPVPYLAEFSHHVVDFFRVIWWGLALGIVAVAALSGVPRAWIAAVLGRPGSLSGIFRAVLAGLLLDLCSHGILLVGMKLYERGASVGQTFAFLIASPWNSLAVTFMLWSLIGLPWTLVFIGFSIVIAIVAGIAADALVRRGVLQANPHAPALSDDVHLLREIRQALRHARPSFGGVVRALHQAAMESRMILRWMFLGVILAAALRTFVPPDAFSALFGPSIAGLLATLLFATILEVCSEGSSPVAADFLLRAQAPGNAFAFLMTGVATDYTEILSLRETTKSWKTAFFLPVLTVPQVVVLAWLLNSFS